MKTIFLAIPLLILFTFLGKGVLAGCEPAVKTQPLPISLCESGDNDFKVKFTSASPVTYQWEQSSDNVSWSSVAEAYPFSGTQTDSLHLDSAYVALHNTYYRCVATNSCGSAISNAVQLKVLTQVDISVTPNPVDIYPGDTAWLTATGASSYVWTPNTFLTDNRGTYVGAFPTTDFDYKVRGVLKGCKTTAGSGGINCAWTPKDSCVASNRLDTLGNHVWYYDDVIDSIRICPCEVGGGGIPDDGYTVHVRIKPPIDPVFAPIAPLCQGDPAPTLPSVSLNGITGSWTPNTVNTISTGFYSFQPDPGQHANSASTTVTVGPPAIPTFPPIYNICKGDIPPILPPVSDAGVTGTWSPATIDNATSGIRTHTFTPTPGICASTVTITVTVIEPTAPAFNPIAPICEGSSITLPIYDPVALYPFTWSPATVDNTSTGTYYCTPSPGACMTTGSITITVIPKTIPLFSPVADLCLGSVPPVLPPVSLNGISGSWTPAINTGSGGTTIHTFTPDAGQCAAIATLTITVTSTPSTPVFAAIGPFCYGTVVPVLPALSNNGIQGTWFPLVIDNQSAGTYTFTPDAGQCGAQQATVAIDIYQLQPPVISASGPVTFCEGGSVELTSSYPSGNSWSPVVSGNQTIHVTGSGMYTVSNVDNNGCEVEAAVTVVVNPAPVVPVVNVNSPVCVGEALNFSANGIPGLTYLWTGPNGFSSAAATPSISSASLSADGQYTLTITSGDCSSSADFPVVVNALPAVSCSAFPHLCVNNDPITLNQGTPQGGVYTGTGVVAGQQFDPAISHAGTFVLMYTYSNGLCSKTVAGSIIVDGCAGLEENQQSAILLYPNPSSGIITLVHPGKEITAVRIYDQSGRLLLVNNEPFTTELQLDCSGFNDGIYSVEIETAAIISRTQMVIKK